MTGDQRRRRRDRGQAAIEYLGFLPILLIVGLAGLQLGVAAYAAQQAGTAAVRPPGPRAPGRRAATWTPRRRCGGPRGRRLGHRVSVAPAGGEVVATVTVRIPSVVPFWHFDDVRKTATMPLPETSDEEDLP
ncbi:septum site-determining protein [Streptomyces diastatochromogenes]|nr:septum site-determining protein [Streptomyces diastatochromogenes]